jgi:Carbohydrate esterase, sialic acid-specific acetylesterase
MKQFLLFGQSNMAGADAVSSEPWQAIPSDERSRLYLGWNLKDAPIKSKALTLPPTSILTDTLIHGPEIGFARALQASIPDDYLFVKTTDNTPPAETEFLWAIDKPYMRNTVSFFDSVCRLENAKLRPDAVLMAQGIDEALSDCRCANYKMNLFRLINAIRTHLDDPSLPFIIGHSVDLPYALPSRMAFVRRSQRLASAALHNVGLVSIDDLTPYIRGHHLSSSSQLEFGRRFALKFLDCYKR